jgi:acyl-CoA synthetase (AMP-forming)/AMP-acid ligase II
MTIIDFLKNRAQKNADDTAFRFLENGDVDGPVTEWSFSQLYHQSIGVSQDLLEQGLAASNVLLAFPPGLDFVKAFYGCLLAGLRAVPVPLPDPKSHAPLDRILRTARVCTTTTVLTNAQMAQMGEKMGKGLPIDLKAVTDQTGTAWHGPEPAMDDVAYLQFTSGSTGHPKGVAIKHANIVANLRVMGQMLRIKSDQPAIVWAPHYHDLCLVGHVLGPVYYGFESILMSPMDFLIKPVRWLKAISHYKVANTACPNFGYEYAARRIKPDECDGIDLSSWRVAGNGGEPVLEQTLNLFSEKFKPCGFAPQAFMPTYGMAESVLFVAGKKPMEKPPEILTLSADHLEKHQVQVLAPDEPGGRKVISCGSPASDHHVIAVDPIHYTQCTPDQVGELWVQGPSVPGIYWAMPDESEATFQGQLADSDKGPYLRTGDLGFVRENQVYVTGRLKDLIIIAGRNHYPSDIELTVQNSGAPVRLGASVAVSQIRNETERLVIIAEIDDRKLPVGTDLNNPDSNALADFWADAVRKIQGAVSKIHGLSIASLVFVAPRSLEKTSSGKPRRKYYKGLYEKQALRTLYEKKSYA